MSSIIFTYNEKEYNSSYAVRQAIWENEHKMFMEVPADKEQWPEFWGALDVSYVEIPDPVPSLTEVKERKLNDLTYEFDSFVRNCGFNSSVGFMVNGDETANRNVDMLIRFFPTGVETVEFCGYDNIIYYVTKAQLETILQEIVINGQYLYQQKWEYRDRINSAKTHAKVEEIEIVFECKDFS